MYRVPPNAKRIAVHRWPFLAFRCCPSRMEMPPTSACASRQSIPQSWQAGCRSDIMWTGPRAGENCGRDRCRTNPYKQYGIRSARFAAACIPRNRDHRRHRDAWGPEPQKRQRNCERARAARAISEQVRPETAKTDDRVRDVGRGGVGTHRLDRVFEQDRCAWREARLLPEPG